MPQVSVVIPTYNRADLIPQTLLSVAEQTLTDWECIIVDDGSTDNTRAVVEGLSARDARFRYVWQENSSASAARNHGIRLARGEFIAFLDSDDLFPPDKLQWQVQVLAANPDAVLVYGNTFIFHGGDPQNGGLYLERIVKKPTSFKELITCSSIYSPLVRADILRKTAGFDTSLLSAEDWDMWLTLSRMGKIIFDPRIGLLYRAHEGGKSNRTFRNYSCAQKVLQKHIRDLPIRERRALFHRAQQYFRSGYTQRLLNEAHQLTLSNDWAAARQVWRAVASLDPRLLRKRSVLFNGLWAFLPTTAAPIWRRLREAKADSLG